MTRKGENMTTDIATLEREHAEAQARAEALMADLVAARHRRAALQANSPDPSTDKMHVGSILVSSWGYDQTNVDFFIVTRTTKACVYIRKIRSDVTVGEPGPFGLRGTDYAVPSAGREPYTEGFGSVPMRKKVQTYDGKPYVRLNTYASAYLWNGQPQYQTGSGLGH